MPDAMGFSSIGMLPIQLLWWKWGGEVKVFSCVEQGGKYVSVNTDGVIVGEFSIREDDVIHAFAKTSFSYPVAK